MCNRRLSAIARCNNNNNNNNLGILELDQIKEHKMKNKVTAEYKRRLRLTLKSKLSGKNKIQS